MAKNRPLTAYALRSIAMLERKRQPDGAQNGVLPGGKRAGAATFVRGVVIPAVLIIAAVHLFGYFQTDTLETRLQKALVAGNHKSAAAIYRELINEDFYRIEYHRGRLLSELRQTARPDTSLCETLDQYRRYADDDDPAAADIGWYGLGLAASTQGRWPDALAAFEKIQNRRLPFLNNSLGHVYLQLADAERAEAAFRREIELDGNRQGAYANLARLYYAAGDFDSLEDMLIDTGAAEHMPLHIRRAAAIKSGNFGAYLRERTRMNHITLYGLLAAAVVVGLWFGYLRGLDVFEPEPIAPLLLTLAMGMAFSTLCPVWYDVFDVVMGLRLGDGLWRDFVYCIVAIGLIEETLKIIPFLLMLRFSRHINESLDYIIYASTAALGFAFMENLMYFQDPGLGGIVSRTFSAVLIHISLTTFAAYGLFCAKYKKHGPGPLLYFALSFTAAVIIHGVYDFWLLAEGLDKPFRLLSLVILIVCVLVFSKMVKNGLNQSEFNTDAKSRIEHRTHYLVYFLSAVFLMQYILMAIRCGVDNANIGMARSAAFVYFPLLAVFGNLGTLEIRKDQWIPLFGRIREQKFNRNA